MAELMTPGEATEPIRDPKDAPFVALAAARPAPDLIVAGDSDFEQGRYGDIPVVTAPMLVGLLRQGQA